MPCSSDDTTRGIIQRALSLSEAWKALKRPYQPRLVDSLDLTQKLLKIEVKEGQGPTTVLIICLTLRLAVITGVDLPEVMLAVISATSSATTAVVQRAAGPGAGGAAPVGTRRGSAQP